MDKILNKIDKLFMLKKYQLIQESLIEIYFELGRYLENNNLNDVQNLLRERYGLLIGFSRRNLKNMQKFYSLYKDKDINFLKKISWDNHLIIMKKDNKEELMNYCINYNIDRNNLKKIIRNGFDIKYTSSKNLENDIVTLEIISIIGSKF